MSGADRQGHVSLCEALDRLLHKGVVLKGEVTISVAEVDLVYLGFQALLASSDTARDYLEGQRVGVVGVGRAPERGTVE